MMTHTYRILGATCAQCDDKITKTLSQVKDITDIKVDTRRGELTLSMKHHIPLQKLNVMIKEAGHYDLQMLGGGMSGMSSMEGESKLKTYCPLILVFVGILIVTGVLLYGRGDFGFMYAMQVFMGVWFIVFGALKLVDLKGFADAYAAYDIVAKRRYVYGYAYPFIELALGFMYLTYNDPLTGMRVNTVAAIVMLIGSIGVIKATAKKKAIQCACIGTFFKLPMSKVTIFEDLVMLIMAIRLLIYNINLL